MSSRDILGRSSCHERYCDKKSKELCELKLGLVTDEEYKNKFLELLRYASYLKDEKAKVQIFFNGLPLVFKDRIEYDEPESLEEVIVKLKHRCEQ